MEQIVITHPNGERLHLFSKQRPSAISKATQKVALLSDDLVSLTVVSAEPLNFDFGDVITIFGKPYKLNQLPEPTKEGERKYTYEVTLEGTQYDLIDVIYKLPEGCYGEQLYGDLKAHLNALIWNLNRIYPGKWILGTFPANTPFKNLNATGKNCLQVLQEYCEQYGVEFGIVINTAAGTYTLNIVEKVGVTQPFTLQYGRGKGLYKLQRKNINNAGITTRLYAYGGSNNLGSSYGHNKLCLPGTTRLTSYVESATGRARYGIKENEKTFDDIKPERLGEVTSLGGNVLSFSDSSMFDLNEREQDGTTTKYLIEGATAKVTFQTGNLAGYSFDVRKYDNTTHMFVINKFTDENGTVFPSETSAAFQIAVGDKYIIEDINLPQQYITDAEARLLEQATKELEKVEQPQVSYALELDAQFFAKTFGQEVSAEILHVGDFIRIVDEGVGVDKEVRITRIERNLLKEHSYSITLADTVQKSNAVRVINEIKDINDVINLNGLADPAVARRRWQTAQELLSMVFDPDGDYFSEKIKPLSIETAMLAVGAKSQQFVLKNVTFEPNYNSSYIYLRISAGMLEHYAISEEGVVAWNIAGGTLTLDTSSAYYIYARCSKANDTGSWLITKTQYKVEDVAGYYMFLIGTVSSPQTIPGTLEAVRSVSLTYGFSTVNGRHIKTGRIESTAGNCYFDLDNNKIGGVLQFVKSDGTVGNVADINTKADDKRRVFVATPYPPYDVGDIWLTGGKTNGQLFRCVTALATGSYRASDWEEAVYYDNTKTTIDGGIVTSGTVQLVSTLSESIVAGITGGENETSSTSTANKVRIWAGASKEQRFSAPFRVLQDGTIHATKANIEGTIKATDGEFRGKVYATDGEFAGRIYIGNGAIRLEQDGSGSLGNGQITWQADFGALTIPSLNVGNLWGFSQLGQLVNYSVEMWANAAYVFNYIKDNDTTKLPTNPKHNFPQTVINCTEYRNKKLSGNGHKIVDKGSEYDTITYSNVVTLIFDGKWYVISRYDK